MVDERRYTSQSEAVRAALRLLGDKERLREMKLEALREKIQEELEGGEATEWNIEEFKETALDAARREAERAWESREGLV